MCANPGSDVRIGVPQNLPQSMRPSPRVVEPARTDFRNIAAQAGLTQTLPFPRDCQEPKKGHEPLTRRLEDGRF